MMAIYGRVNNKRKRLSLSLTRLIFSSDEDEENNIETPESGSRLSELMQETTIERPKESGLLPPVSISKSNNKSRTKSPRKSPKKIDEALIEDHLTKSPKRYVKVVNYIMDGPDMTSVSPLVSTIKKAQPQKQIFELILPLSSPKKTISTSKSINMSPRKTPNSTPNENDAWKDLFENIECVEPISEKLSISAKREDVKEESQDVIELVINNIDLDNIYRSLNQEIKPVSNPMRKPRLRNIYEKHKTYGEQRSYLLEQVEAESLGEHQVINKEMISNYYDYQESNKDTVNINDLRYLGKRNSDKEELEYLLGGIVFNSGKIIESCNQILISSLIDLKNFNCEFLMKNCIQIIKRLNKLLSRVAKVRTDNGLILIMYLIQQNLIWFLDHNLNKEAIDEINDECMELIFKTLSFEVDSLHVLSVTRNNLACFIDQAEKVKITDILIDQDRIYNDKIFAIMKSSSQPCLKYFENFYQRYPTHRVDEIDTYISESFQNICKFKIEENEMSLMKILVMVSTNSNQHFKTHMEPLLKLINHNYDKIINNEMDDNMTNASLFAMGYIINVIEHDRAILFAYLDLLNNTEQKIHLIEPDTEIINHLIGYNSIILSFYIEDLELKQSHIVHNLKTFKSTINNAIFEDKITTLLSKLTHE